MCKSSPPQQAAAPVIGTPGDPAKTVVRQAPDAVAASGLRKRTEDSTSGTLLGQAPSATPSLGG